MVVSNIFDFHPGRWGNDPISLAHMFQMGVKNHQLVFVSFFVKVWDLKCFATHFVANSWEEKTKNPKVERDSTPSHNTLSPIIMVQWKMAFVRKRSNWRYTYFSLNHGRNQNMDFQLILDSTLKGSYC